MARVSVVVPVRNAAPTLPRTLSALADQDLEDPYEVIVVDDGSADGSAELAERFDGAVTVLRQRNLGAGAARNRGAAAASGEVLAFTDADCYPTCGWLSAGVTAVARYDLVQGRVLPDPQTEVGPFDRTLWVEHETALYQTANLFVRRTAFNRVGGFEGLIGRLGERPFGEDVWLGWRVRRSGGRAAFCPEALVHHAVFNRRAGEYVREHWRRRHFPALAATIPELRRELFYARAFLDRRAAALDAALGGTLAAAALRSPLPLAAGLPYLATLARRARPHGRRVHRAVAVYAAADAVSLAALLYGSVRHRAPLI